MIGLEPILDTLEECCPSVRLHEYGTGGRSCTHGLSVRSRLRSLLRHTCISGRIVSPIVDMEGVVPSSCTFSSALSHNRNHSHAHNAAYLPLIRFSQPTRFTAHKGTSLYPFFGAKLSSLGEGFSSHTLTSSTMKLLINQKKSQP